MTPIGYVRERSAFGEPIGAYQNTWFRLAELATEIDIAQQFTDWCVLELNDGALTHGYKGITHAMSFGSRLTSRWMAGGERELHGGLRIRSTTRRGEWVWASQEEANDHDSGRRPQDRIKEAGEERNEE